MSKIIGKVMNKSGTLQEIELSAEDYKGAKDANMSFEAYLDNTYGKDVDTVKEGSIYTQLKAQTGMLLQDSFGRRVGERTIASITQSVAAISRDSETLVSYLTPQVVLDVVESHLKENKTADSVQFERLVGHTVTIQDDRYEQPVVDFRDAGEQEMNPISQLALPNIIGTIDVGQRAGTIPTLSLGLEMSDKAKKNFTFDFIGIVLSQQAEKQRIKNTNRYFHSLVQGDVDANMRPLPVRKAVDFDAEATGGKFTERAYLKWMLSHRNVCSFDWLLMDLETYFRFEARSGRFYSNAVGTDGGIPVAYPQMAATQTKVANMNLEVPNVYIVQDGAIPAGQIVGLDSRYAITRMRNSEADYKASQDLIMRRGTQMRWDVGETVFRTFDEAWGVLDIN